MCLSWLASLNFPFYWGGNFCLILCLPPIKWYKNIIWKIKLIWNQIMTGNLSTSPVLTYFHGFSFPSRKRSESFLPFVFSFECVFHWKADHLELYCSFCQLRHFSGIFDFVILPPWRHQQFSISSYGDFPLHSLRNHSLLLADCYISQRLDRFKKGHKCLAVSLLLSACQSMPVKTTKEDFHPGLSSCDWSPECYQNSSKY